MSNETTNLFDAEYFWLLGKLIWDILWGKVAVVITMSSRGNIHWCHQRRRLIRPRIEGMGCPSCDGGFVQELSELAGGRVRDSLDRLVRTMKAFDLSMFRSHREYRLEVCNALVTCSVLRARHLMHEYSSLWSTRMPVDSNGGFELFVNGDSGNIGDIYTRFGLNELIERVLIEVQSSLRAPGPRSAIDAMLKIKITPTHIECDSHSHCPVCKDLFEFGTEAEANALQSHISI